MRSLKVCIVASAEDSAGIVTIVGEQSTVLQVLLDFFSGILIFHQQYVEPLRSEERRGSTYA